MLYEVPWVVVRVAVAFAIAQILHQLRGRITQVERYGEVARLLDEGEGTVDRHIGAIALLATSQVDDRLGQGDATLGPADALEGLGAGGGEKEGVGVSKANVFGCGDHQSACDERRVFASLDETCEPINSGIGVTSSDALDECRSDVVVEFTTLVEGQGIRLHTLTDQFVGDLKRVGGRR